MTPKFSRKEKEELRHSLIKNAKKLFSKKGFKNTKVSEITEMTGIATGTFYSYFNSKEELFLTIFVKENTKLKEEIVKAVAGENDPAIAVKNMTFSLFNGMKSNPILKEYFNQDMFKKIEEKANFNPEGEYAETAQNLFFPLVEKWQEEGKIKKLQPGFVLAFFDALFYVYLHQEDIGTEFFPELLDNFIDFIVQGITENK